MEQHDWFSDIGDPTEEVKNASYYRLCARNILKGKWVTSSLSAFLLGLLVVGVMLAVMIPTMVFVMLATGATVAGAEPSDGVIVAAVLGVFALLFGAIALLLPPLMIGYYRFYLEHVDGMPPNLGTLFWGFRNCFGKSIGLYLLYCLRMLGCYLWVFAGILVGAVASLFATTEQATEATLAGFAILGVVAVLIALVVQSYRYSMSFFILAEFPFLSVFEVMRRSRALMKGKKWRLFCLQFSFIGWVLLLIPAGILTCGIGLSVGEYVLSAYMMTATAAFYDDISHRAAIRQAKSEGGFEGYTPQVL